MIIGLAFVLGPNALAIRLFRFIDESNRIHLFVYRFVRPYLSIRLAPPVIFYFSYAAYKSFSLIVQHLYSNHRQTPMRFLIFKSYLCVLTQMVRLLNADTSWFRFNLNRFASVKMLKTPDFFLLNFKIKYTHTLSVRKSPGIKSPARCERCDLYKTLKTSTSGSLERTSGV